MTSKKEESFDTEQHNEDAATKRKEDLQAAGLEEVELDEPVFLHGKEVDVITVRKPKSGALRGCSLVDLLNMDVIALTKVLPRVTSPTLDENTIKRMSPADLVQLGAALAGFLVSKRMKDDDFQA